MTDQSFEKGSEVISRPSVLFFFFLFDWNSWWLLSPSPHTQKKKRKRLHEKNSDVTHNDTSSALLFISWYRWVSCELPVLWRGREGGGERKSGRLSTKRGKGKLPFCISLFDSLLAFFLFCNLLRWSPSVFLVSFFFSGALFQFSALIYVSVWARVYVCVCVTRVL